MRLSENVVKHLKHPHMAILSWKTMINRKRLKSSGAVFSSKPIFGVVVCIIPLLSHYFPIIIPYYPILSRDFGVVDDPQHRNRPPKTFSLKPLRNASLQGLRHLLREHVVRDQAVGNFSWKTLHPSEMWGLTMANGILNDTLNEIMGYFVGYVIFGISP